MCLVAGDPDEGDNAHEDTQAKEDANPELLAWPNFNLLEKAGRNADDCKHC